MTPRGSKRLAGYILRTMLDTIGPGMPGINPTGEEGFGTSEGFTSRRYEFGDDFSRIDTEATLLCALERDRTFPVRFSEKDIRIRENIISSRIANGLMIDASGSMKGDKLAAARGVIEEARRCSMNGITVNIVMLDEATSMGDLASRLAKHNSGRVFFTAPGNLGKVVVEDYLRKTKKRGLGR